MITINPFEASPPSSCLVFYLKRPIFRVSSPPPSL